MGSQADVSKHGKCSMDVGVGAALTVAALDPGVLTQSEGEVRESYTGELTLELGLGKWVGDC